MSYTEEELEAAWNETRGERYLPWADCHEDARERYRKFANALPHLAQGEPIAREDIRDGDTVRRVTKVGAVTSIVETTVKRLSNGNISLEDEGGWVTPESDEKHGATYYLINRPAPKLPAEPGSLIEAYEVRGIAGKWHLRLGHSGYWRSFEKVRGCLVHLPEYITAWKPADFVVRDGNE